MKQKINWMGITIIILVVINLIDLITAKRILIGEANPLYIVFKGYWILILAKLLFIAIMLWVYRSIKRQKYGDRVAFFFCMLMIYSIIAVGIGVFANLSVSDETLEYMEVTITELENKSEQGDVVATQQLKQIEKEKLTAYGILVWVAVYFPVIFGFISFCLFDSSKKYFGGKNGKG